MADDYIPSNDGELIEFADNFISKISGNEASLGLVVANTNSITARRSTFNISYLDNNAAQMAARGTREKKDTDRKPLVTELRAASQIIQANPNVTDAQRAELGLKVRETSTAPTGAPDSRPILEIDTSEPLRHTVKFYDNALETKGKPDGVKGAEIWCKIGGEATMNEEDYRYLGTDTASPYLAIHRPENVGNRGITFRAGSTIAANTARGAIPKRRRLPDSDDWSVSAKYRGDGFFRRPCINCWKKI